MDSIRDTLFKMVPALTSIFKAGFIPERDDFLELTEEMYESYYRQGGERGRRVYMLAPRGESYFTENSREVNIVFEDEIETMLEGARFLREYVRADGQGFTRDADILAYVAERIPPDISEGTPYEQSPLRVLRPGEEQMNPREVWGNFLAASLGYDANIALKITYADTGEVEHRVVPAVRRNTANLGRSTTKRKHEKRKKKR